MTARPIVLGPTVDAETRCVHWHGPLDVVAIRFACCGEFYPCSSCHAEVADHPARQWPASAFGTDAILCGVCGHTFSIERYLDADQCPSCGAVFNPGCRLHAHHYFEVGGPDPRE